MLSLIAALVLAAAEPSTTVSLPLHGPLPVPRPERSVATGVENAPEIAKPEDDRTTPESSTADERIDTQMPLPPPIEREDPVAYAFCIAELRKTGAQFTEKARIDDGNGCGVDRPIELRSLGGGVALSPPGTLRCRTAINLARWTRDVVVPTLGKARPDEKLASVDQASAYVCRKRNGADTGKVSEHARGTAVDIAGFTFRSGGTFTIAPREEDSTLNGAFQRAIASAACLYFSTVLDPGSDAAHETHLHLDMLERKGGYRYCW